MSTVTSSRSRHRELGLTDHEYELILEALGREPNHVELAMLSLMWSEHCAYKHSRKLLRRLPTEGRHVLLGPGENAGAVDVGGGLAVAFKVESHNHPSAVEPFQGAATGVGGIIRDVFAVGARPVAVLDSLRFGEAARSAGATGSAAHRCWRAQSSARATRRSVPRFRSATRSRRRSCWSAASSCSTASCWSPSRTSALPASPRPPRRWRARGASGSTS